MNDWLVGSRRVEPTGITAGPQDEDGGTAALQVHWATVDGVPLPGTILGVSHNADSGFHTVTASFACRTYQTVDFDGEHDPRSHTATRDILADIGLADG